MTLFLTGGTGFIGQPLTRQLLSQGWQVKALVRNPQSKQALELAAMGANLVQGDILDRESMRTHMAGVEVVVHNAGMYEIGLDAAGNKHMHDINVQGTDNVLGLAHELGIPRAVHVSSVVCWGASTPEPCDESYPLTTRYTSFYDETKTKAHQIALEYASKGLSMVIVCPNQVIGPNDHSAYGYFLRMYLNKIMPPTAWTPEVIHTFVHVDDLVEGIILATSRGRAGETYFLCGEPISRRAMLDFWSRFPGGAKFRVYLPKPIAWAMFAPMEPLLHLAGLPGFISRESVTGSVHRNFSGDKARRELGWKTRSAEEAWTQIIQKEMKLVNARKDKGWVERLKPV
jgi:nucleoside-diphosphate-sugar epimerase